MVRSFWSITSLVVVTYVLMILLNGLANVIPINGVTTGEVSDAYFDLFAPATVTFSIWGLIYLLLAGYTLFQLGLFQEDRGAARAELFRRIGLFFAISSVANALWIIAWHYQFIGVSLLLIIIVLGCLYMISTIVEGQKFSVKEKVLIQLPFRVYFGWITVATIANFVTFLVSIGWTGIATQFWTAAMLLLGLAIGIAVIKKFRDLAYGLVLIWAYSGILIKHISPAEFGGQYPLVIATVIIALVALVVAEILLVYVRPGKAAGEAARPGLR